MAWRKSERKPLHKGLQKDVATIRTHGVYFGAAFVHANKLENARSAEVWVDDAAKLIGFRFSDTTGGFALTPTVRKGVGFTCGCRAEIKRLNAVFGYYNVTKDRTGLFIIDTRSMVRGR